ncbi:acyltransferase [Labrenzia sp. CE80]|uniref:acyltransferase family protein n=1 Tax=Labrenzia sp. CE80 TaxID=1788986 RepID=UPI00129B3C72|nr:acyltransferase [Labrenzia sp. CE80]
MLIQLQYLRAIAALLVVYFHTILQLPKLYSSPALEMPVVGETGVDLFFVTSGFVMWFTTAGKQTSLREFYKRRIERIVPLYWLFTLLAAAIAFLLPSYLKSTTFDLPHLLASLFFVPWMNPADLTGAMIAPVVIPGWTLNYEMYFYIIFGGLLFAPKSLRPALLTIVLFAMFVAANAFVPESVLGRFYGNSIVFEFLAGVLIAKLYLAKRLAPQGIAITLAVLSFCLLLVGEELKWEGSRFLVAGLPAAIVIYCLVSIDFTRLREWRFLHYLGDASYSLYITHVFVLTGTRILFSKVTIEWAGNEFLFIVACLVNSIVFAILIYQFFELPIARRFKERRQSRVLISEKRPIPAGTKGDSA